MSVRLNFEDNGDGPALIVVHGLYGSSTNWRSLGKQLAERHRVISVDLRNHGSSPWSSEMNYPAMAADLVALLDELALPSAHLLGHSMGGKACMTVALTAAERVQRLIVVDIAPVTYSHDLSEFIGAMRSVDLSRVQRRADVDAQLAGAIDDRGIRAFLIQNLRQQAGQGYSWRINLESLSDNMARITGFPAFDAEFKGPSLFIHGTASHYVSAAHRPVIARLFPAARFAPIEGAGHWVHAERPAKVLELVNQFLDE